MTAKLTPSLLTINSGSSSLKFALFAINKTEPLQHLYQGEFSNIGESGQFQVHDASGHLFQTQNLNITDHQHALKTLLTWLAESLASLQLICAGHRVVHGGTRFHQPVVITETTLSYLTTLIPLAPNHQPACLAGIITLQELEPALVQVACFDTMFHHHRADAEQFFAIPQRAELNNIRRYGFHGLSYQYIANVMPDYLGTLAEGKVIVAHLGHGASLCAMHKRQSVATTMTFTPLDGIPMGTRCGSIDPAVVLYLLQQGMTSDAISDLLYFQSGLLGVSAETDNMSKLLASSSVQAQQAIEQFVHHTVRAIGSLAAALGGIDALIFTAGIGEHAETIRASICKRCEWLGLQLNTDANSQGQACISQPSSPVQAWVIHTDEERVIAEQTYQLFNDH